MDDHRAILSHLEFKTENQPVPWTILLRKPLSDRHIAILRAVNKIQTKGHSGECCASFNFIDLTTP